MKTLTKTNITLAELAVTPPDFCNGKTGLKKVTIINNYRFQIFKIQQDIIFVFFGPEAAFCYPNTDQIIASWLILSGRLKTGLKN